MKYIPVEKLIAEIEFAKSVYDNPKRVIHGVADAFRQDGGAAMCDDILKKIAPLQQEQPLTTEKVIEQCKKFGGNPEIIQQGMDFEKEYKSYIESRKDDLSGNAVTVNMKDLARHFYQLGVSVMRERITNPEYNQKIIEKMKSEYPTDEFNVRKK